MRRHLLLLLLLLPAVGVAVLAIAFGHRVGWDTLARHQAMLLHTVAAHRWAAPALFMLAYVLVATLSLPQATMLTVAGGLLFGTVSGGMLSIVGATLGASLLLLVARSALGGILQRRFAAAEPMMLRLRRDGFSYLLALRLVPLAPFWAVNLAAALIGMRLRAFVPATLFGIAPASFVLSSIGAGLGDILAQGRTPDLLVLISPRIVLPLLALAGLSLLPPLLRRYRALDA